MADIRYCKHCGKDISHTRKVQLFCSNSCARFERERISKVYDHSTTVWSCGGGVQSTAIAALICSGDLPKPDFALMVDTGMERTSTWEYVNNQLIPNLKASEIDLIILKTTDYTDTELFKNGCFLLPAHRLKNGKKFKMKTMCNESWKVRVQRKYIKDQGISCFENWIGISTDEKRRVRESPKKYARLRYPLIEMGISRYGCIDLIKSLGWEIPPHTACWCCPNASNDEWLDLKLNHEEDWEKAIELERKVREVDDNIYFHYSLKPLEEAFS